MNHSHNAQTMDFKGFIFYVGALAVDSFHGLLSNGVLAANLVYIVYQIYSHHKRHKKENDKEQ